MRRSLGWITGRSKEAFFVDRRGPFRKTVGDGGVIHNYRPVPYSDFRGRVALSRDKMNLLICMPLAPLNPGDRMQDLLSRLIYGTRHSSRWGVVKQVQRTVTLGYSRYHGGWVDSIIMHRFPVRFPFSSSP